MKVSKKLFQVAVIGSAGSQDYLGKGGASQPMEAVARELGRKIAQNGWVLVTGGKDGIMEAACAGAKESGGLTVGVVKGKNRFTSNPFIDVEVVSGMEADGLDELLVVYMSDLLISIGGGAGTLQEMTVAYRNGKPVIAFDLFGGWSSKLSDSYLDERERVKVVSVSCVETALEKAKLLLEG